MISEGAPDIGIETSLVLRERDHVAEVRLSGEDHRHSVDPERDSTVRRRAHGKRVEEEPELRSLLLRCEREETEHLLLDLGLVNPE